MLIFEFHFKNLNEKYDKKFNKMSSITELLNYEMNIQVFMIANGFFDGAENFESPDDLKDTMTTLSLISNVDQFFNTTIFKKNKKINDMMIDKLSGKDKDNDNTPCPRCGGERKFLRVQRRAGDEGANNELHCVSCGLVQQC